jgi:hypothetical protein
MCTESSVLITLPKRAALRIETELPKHAKDATEKLLEKRPILLTEKLEPIVISDSKLTLLPVNTVLREKLEPHRRYDRSESEEPSACIS